MQEGGLALSVIISTLDRYDCLESCLEALSPSFQTALDPYEVIVVDQSTGRGRGREIIERFPFVEIRRLSSRGLATSRNFGVSVARANIVAFLDDDAVADRRWVEEMIASFRDPDRDWVQISGGRVIADYGSVKKPGWLKPPLERFLSCIDFGEDAGPLREGQWIVGANFAIRTRLIRMLGGFNTGLGRRGGTDLLSNEEAALVQAVGHDGVLYNPAAKVTHLIQPDRVAQQWFRKRVAWQAVSDVMSQADFLKSRLRARKDRGDDALLQLQVAELFSEAPGYEQFEAQLERIYDLVSASLLGRLFGPGRASSARD
jgi:glucosyl-dolichyl phosphate glucuronosyltransferase